MSDQLLIKDLQDQIDSGQVVAIIGAGVSMGATDGNSLASWTGLLEHGVNRCWEVAQPLPQGWKERLLREVHSGDMDDLLSAAEKVSRKLGAPDGGEYRRWLRETVGSFNVKSAEVINALNTLGVKLTTTNYDGLLEEVSGCPPVTWMDGAKVERVLRGDEQGILHLHGYWDRPESVVLGIRSYEKVLGDAHAQAMQSAIRSLKTLLFVGCGEGLHDPNFEALLEWTSKVFQGSEYRQFRLARESEVGELQTQHPAEQRIFVLSYGKKYGELAPFLRGFRAGPGTGQKAKASSPAPGQAALLPPAPRCFGRESEIEDLVSTVLATPAPPVPLLGPPGIGKSAITLVALNEPRVANRYGKRRFFIRCDSATSREMLVAEIARNAGLQVGPNLEATLLAMLESAPVALAVDNAETPWEGDTLRVEEFLAQLAAVPGLALIASLRGATRPGSVKWRQAIQPRQLPLLEARKAFLAIAGEKFASDPHLDELLGALDGIPLAITLLGYASEGEPDLNGLWARWQQERIDILQRAGADHRLLNIEVSYEISLKGPRMTVEGLRLLRVLGCLPNGMAHSDLDGVYPGYGHKAAAILRQVGLAFDEAGRLRALTPLREYMWRKHPPQPGDLESVLAHYLGLAISYGGKVGQEGGADAITRLTPETGNLDTMILRGLDEAQPGLAIQAALSLAEFMRFTGLGSTALLEKAVSIAQNLDSHETVTANCIRSLGDIALERSDHEGARKRYEEALPLYERVGDFLGQANCIRSLGTIARQRSDHEGARKRYEEALPLYQRVSAIIGQANCIYSLGEIALDRSDHEGARKRFEEALPLYQRVGSILGQANCIKRLGDIALARSDHEGARKRYEEASPLYQRVGAIIGQANSTYSLGEIALERSDHEGARKRFEEALPLYQRVGAILGQANCIKRLGDIALARSDHEGARKRYEEASPLYQRVGSILGQANCIYSLGEIALERSDHEGARKRYEEALPLYQRVGAILGQANCIRGLGDIALERSDHEAARQRFEEALGHYEQIQEPDSIGSTHRRLARIARNENERCQQVAAASTAWQSIGRDDLVKNLIDEFGQP